MLNTIILLYRKNMWRGIGLRSLINLITFLIWGIDKWKARKGKWRISEKTLLILSLCGGRVGAILAIEVFKHKTIKSNFLWKFYLIGIFWIIGIGIFLSTI